jgi:hypothetical protein
VELLFGGVGIAAISRLPETAMAKEEGLLK